MHDSSKRIMDDFFDRYILGRENISILDLGSQVVDGNIQNSYRHIFEEKKIVGKYVGVDMVEGDNVDIVLKNPYDWKEIKSKSFDFVICGQVFEHVEFFWITLMEIRRVLKVGGKCCIIAPSSGYEHRYPLDCYRYYPDGMKAISKYVGLETKECYAEWNDILYPLMDIEWRDCVLIGERKKVNAKEFLKYDILNSFIKKCSVLKDISKIKFEEIEKTNYKSDFEIKKNISLLMNKKIYVDEGFGFNELNKLSPIEYKFEKNKFYFKYNINKNYKMIRFDPVEEFGCIISNLKIKSEKLDLKIVNHNASEIDEIGYMFNKTNDPQIIINMDDLMIKEIEIMGEINIIV